MFERVLTSTLPVDRSTSPARWMISQRVMLGPFAYRLRAIEFAEKPFSKRLLQHEEQVHQELLLQAVLIQLSTSPRFGCCLRSRAIDYLRTLMDFKHRDTPRRQKRQRDQREIGGWLPGWGQACGPAGAVGSLQRRVCPQPPSRPKCKAAPAAPA